jgi:excisionase family DNA binding protein
MSSNIQINKPCIFCGNLFTALTLHTRYCSHTCNQKHYKQIKREEKLNLYRVKEKLVSAPGITSSTIDQKVFLSIDETATLLGASRRTIQRLISKGALKVGKVGSRSIVQRAEIDKIFK